MLYKDITFKVLQVYFTPIGSIIITKNADRYRCYLRLKSSEFSQDSCIPFVHMWVDTAGVHVYRLDATKRPTHICVSLLCHNDGHDNSEAARVR